MICLEYGEVLEKNSLGSPLPFFRRTSTTLRVMRVMVKGQGTAAVFHNLKGYLSDCIRGCAPEGAKEALSLGNVIGYLFIKRTCL